jgi:hypothetical protein
MDKNMVTLKIGKTIIQCRPEDVGNIMSSVSTAPVTAEKKYEKSTVIHKAIRNLEANTPEELVIGALANRSGIHTVFSGLNEELRNRFGADPIDVTEKMMNAGLIKGRPAKKGFWITK